MTPKERYAKALQELIEAQKEVEKDNSNPFNFGLPTHLGLPDESFISDEELDQLSEVIGAASDDNRRFAKIWNIGTEILVKAKSLFL
jgi:hypothetical protein